MKTTPFRIVYIGTTVWAAIAILIYLFQLLAHRQPFPSVLHTLWLLSLLTFPRLLCLNVFLHRGLAHDAFQATSSLFQHITVILASLSLLPYSPHTWAQRHLHYHTRHPHIQHVPSEAVSAAVLDGVEKQPDDDEIAEHAAARVIAPVEYRPSMWRMTTQLHALWRYEDLWQPVPEEGSHSRSASAEKLAAQHYHVVVAAVFNVLAFFVLMRVHSQLHTAMVLYYVPSLLAVSQLYLWMASAALLNHSLAFPLLGYQLYLNPHHNNLLVSLLTAGGGYLNNHHAQPSHPFHTVLPYELDLSAILIRLLSYCRLITLTPSAVPPKPVAFPTTAVLTGRVSHTRMWPFYHRFEYSVSFMRVELSPLTPLALDAYPLYSSRGRRWWLGVGINPRAYLAADQVLRLCAEEGVAKERLTAEAGARVVLVTCPSYLGYAMNPISYYVVYSRPVAGSPPANVDPQLGELVALVSEVHNTPWGQRCHYVHAAQREQKAGECEGWLCDVKDKKMHVSPFMSMHYTYTLHYTLPTLHRWDIRWTMQHTPQPEAPQPSTMALSSRNPIQPNDGIKTDVEKRHFKAVMWLEGTAMGQWVALRNVVLYPLQSVRVVWGIYWQAAVLFVRKHAVFYSHPDPNTRLY